MMNTLKISALILSVDQWFSFSHPSSAKHRVRGYVALEPLIH
jgi:hypothetical protein